MQVKHKIKRIYKYVSNSEEYFEKLKNLWDLVVELANPTKSTLALIECEYKNELLSGILEIFINSMQKWEFNIKKNEDGKLKKIDIQKVINFYDFNEILVNTIAQ